MLIDTFIFVSLEFILHYFRYLMRYCLDSLDVY